MGSPTPRSRRSLDDDLRRHFGMNGTEVGEGSFFAERVSELVVCIQRLGLESRLVVAHHGMGNIVAIHPLDSGSLSYLNFTRRKAEVVNLDFALRAVRVRILSRSGR